MNTDLMEESVHNEKALVRTLFPPLKNILSYVPFKLNIPDNRNHWEHINIVMYGKMASGKTETVNYLVYKAKEIYGLDNVNAVFCDGNLGGLINKGMRKNPNAEVMVLFSDNLTKKKIPKKDLEDFYEIRHIARDITGKSTGYIVTILVTHRFHDIMASLRQDPKGFILKSAPTIKNSYDWRFIEKIVGTEGINFLHTIDQYKMEYKVLKGWSVVSMNNECYRVYTSSIPLVMNRL